jgi:acyl-CoA synthetase (AMP-forming)/AMP-acid ligase II
VSDGAAEEKPAAGADVTAAGPRSAALDIQRDSPTRFASGRSPQPGAVRDALVPGGRPDDPAITWRGRTLSYAEMSSLIERAPIGAPLDIGALEVPEALARLFAAARAGSSVLVRDPALPVPDLGALPHGTWLVACTSGSTGSPRAVCRTPASWASSVAPLADLAGLGARDRVLLTGPLHATLHLHAAVHTLVIGAELTDEAESATSAHCVPAVLSSLLASLPEGAPLRTVVVAGAALPSSLAARAADRGMAVTEYYGAAELSFVAARRLPDPVLRPFPGVQVRLSPDGVLWARSPDRALGYAGSSGSVGPLRADADGYATVGDLATVADPLDSDGSIRVRPRFRRSSGSWSQRTVKNQQILGAPDGAAGLTILGRGESAITTGGFTVLAEDVEAVLEQLDGVRAAAAVGLPHPRWGEVVTAVLVLEPGTDLAAVRSGARARLTGPARPRRYVVVDALPRTGGGKVARASLRSQLSES